MCDQAFRHILSLRYKYPWRRQYGRSRGSQVQHFIVRTATYDKILRKHRDVFDLLVQSHNILRAWIVLAPDHRYKDRWVVFSRDGDRWIVSVIGPIRTGQGVGMIELVTFFSPGDPAWIRRKWMTQGTVWREPDDQQTWLSALDT